MSATQPAALDRGQQVLLDKTAPGVRLGGFDEGDAWTPSCEMGSEACLVQPLPGRDRCRDRKEWWRANSEAECSVLVVQERMG